MSAIGMMDGAFFVGRKEVVDWINSTLSLNIAKIEDTASGAIACQLLDIMHPGQVPMHKVNWAAKQSFEFIANYKILQTCFAKLHVDKFVDVDRLISGRYMDNLEFMQWFKRFFEMTVSDFSDYDAVGQRSKGKGGATFQFAASAGGAKKPTSAPSRVSNSSTTSSENIPARVPAAREGTSANAANAKKEKEPTSAHPVKPAVSATTTSATTATKPATTNSAAHAPASKAHHGHSSGAVEQELTTLKAAYAEQSRLYTELKLEVDGLEKERDFYFDKLRDIEIMLQDLEEQGQGNQHTAAILKILYATAEGFEPIDETVATKTQAADAIDGQDGIRATSEEETF